MPVVELPLPEGYRIRAATLQDVPAIVALQAACDLADFGEVDADEEWLRDDWRRPRFDPSTDTWVVTAPGGRLAAAAYTWEELPHTIFDSGGWVHPQHRGLGLGSALVRRVERRALRDVAEVEPGSAPRVHQWFDADNPGARGLFQRLGYAPTREFLHMAIEVGPGFDPGAPPEGIGIRSREERDDPAIFVAVQEAFREHWGFQPQAYEEWSREWRGSSAYDPSLWFVATDGEEIVGAVLSSTLRGRGWIGDLAVRDAWRRRGIGAALLLRAFARFAERGLPTVMLNVDGANTTGATQVYERAGMHVRRRWLVVGRTLTSGTASAG